ncbi:MAG TPA: AcvB/VirJ family lysyl-phosphatidylglycerol hydrolase, partial [Gemmatimonadaceae bacterium]|nr:AcvB/VirJ family lysyl-phosphatidylglycerol hydrolase [Gemmatimonadaceae bacterium]
RLHGTPMLCVFGTGEKDSACPAVPAGLVHRVALEGGHHLGGDYRGLGVLILDALRAGRGANVTGPAAGSGASG